MAAPFFVTGGTMQREAPSYVPRRADIDLLRYLQAGEFCYLLTSRQMGKSSLMIRTASALREAGHAVVIIDLTTLGRNLTAEQWYDGMIALCAEQLGCEDEAEAYWAGHERDSPLRRWTGALTEVMVPFSGPRPVTVFIDEIDVVRSLPFPADEFFAAIRGFYNARGVTPGTERLTFCLLGVASPAELIADPRITPFNIGQRIELTDFTPREAERLAEGLGGSGSARAVLRRVLRWTRGHPYLTQRLCRQAAEAGVVHAGGVDALVARTFLETRSRERDDNLQFVSNRLLAAQPDPVPLLLLYRRVRLGRSVAHDVTNPLVSRLLLSGVVRERAVRLVVRNPIYRRVFSPSWVRDNLPGSERQRMGRAWRRGATVVGLVACVIIAGLGYLALRLRETSAHLRVAVQDLEARDLATMYAIRGISALEKQRTVGLWSLVTARSLVRQREFVPRFDRLWAGWHHSLRGRLSMMVGLPNGVYGVAYSPDGRFIATAGGTAARVWDPTTGRPVTPLLEHGALVRATAFSPDGRRLATVRDGDRAQGTGGAARVWDVATGQPVTPPLRHGKGDVELWAVGYSPDGRFVASAGAMDGAGSLRVWHAKTGAPAFPPFRRSGRGACGLGFCPSGRWLVGVFADGTVVRIDLSTGQAVDLPGGVGGVPEVVSFSPDGRFVASGGDNIARAWTVADGQPHGRAITYPRDGETIRGVALSPDGRYLATTRHHGQVDVADLATGRAVVSYSHANDPWCAEFSPDGKVLVSCGRDGLVRFIDVATGKDIGLPGTGAAEMLSLAFSPDGRHVVTGCGDGNARVWRVPAAGGPPAIVFDRDVPAVAYRPDSTLIVGIGGGWDSQNPARSFPPRVEHWRTGDRRRLKRIELPGDLLLGLSPAGRYAVVAEFRPDRFATTDTRLTVHDVDTGRPVGRPVLVAGRAEQAACDDLGRAVAVQHEQSTVAVFGLADGRHLTTMRVVDGPRRIQFSPDGALLGVCDKAGQVQVLRTSTWQPLTKAWQAHGHEGHDLFFSADGLTLASTGRDGRANVWNLADPPTLRSSLIHANDCRGVALTPDGGYAVTAAIKGDNPVLWEPRTGLPCGPDDARGGWKVAIRPDGAEAAVIRDGVRVELVALPTEFADLATIERATKIDLGVTLGPGDQPVAIPWDEWQELLRIGREPSQGRREPPR